MALTAIWYYTNLPEEVVSLIEKGLTESYDKKLESSRLYDDRINVDKRSSTSAWVPTSEWIGGFLWHYIMRANRENFLYDLTQIDGESMQYTRYGEGEHYDWHTDAGISTFSKPNASNHHNVDAKIGDFLTAGTEMVRKLSFVLQLSGPDDYEGGNLQLMDESGRSIVAPRLRGSMILFDARTPHRVRKVRSGVRKSLVGWTVGPRWK